jgi:hypothetical protein
VVWLVIVPDLLRRGQYPHEFGERHLSVEGVGVLCTKVTGCSFNLTRMSRRLGVF